MTTDEIKYMMRFTNPLIVKKLDMEYIVYYTWFSHMDYGLCAMI